MDGVEKVKKTLNENEQASLNIECILEERDLNDMITRADYVKLLNSSGLLERLAIPINAAFAEAGLDKSQLDAVEWIGSAMRASPLQDAVAKIVGRQLSSTMNAEESVAKGSSLAAALVSPLIKLNKKYKLIDTQPAPISLTWKTLNDPQDTKETTIELFPRKQHFGKAKFVTLNRKDAKPFELVAQYAYTNIFPLTDVSNGLIASARVANIVKEPDSNGSRDAEIRLKIKLDSNGLTYLQEAELVEKKEIEVEIEEKDETPVVPPAQPNANQPPAQPNPNQPPAQAQNQAPPPQPSEDTVMKDAEPVPPPNSEVQQKEKDVEMKDVEPPKPEPPKPKFRKEKQMRTFYNKVPLEVKYMELSPAEIEKATQAEELLRADDNYAIETLNSKNKLESTIFATRDNLETLYARFTVPEEVTQINEYLMNTEDWCYNEGSDVNKEAYDGRFDQLQKLLAPTKGRYDAELKRIEDERKAEEQRRLEEQKRIEEEKKKQEEEQKRIEEEKKKREAEATAGTGAAATPADPAQQPSNT
jgi:molecular chaperone DnaK (HSP70)